MTVQQQQYQENLVQSDQKSSEPKHLKPGKKPILWKHKYLEANNSNFVTENTGLPNAIISLDTPYDFFCYFLNNDILKHIAEQSSLYSTQKSPDKPFHITVSDIQRYIGICLVTSLACIKNIRYYWHPIIGLPLVQETMPVNKFESIRRYLHLNDNSNLIPRGQPGHDKLFKLRPVLEHLLNKFSTVPLEESLSVDEQMCPTKAHHHMKQYLPNKPHKYGYKLFVLSGVSGFTYNFEIYSGQENDPDKRKDNEPDLGASANVVVRLARVIPENKNHKVYHDNFYTSIPLMVFLKKKGILSLGTVRRNRITNCKLPSEDDFKKQPRGTSVEFVGSIDDVEVSNLAWRDNKIVTMLSSFVGTNPTQEKLRYNRKTRAHEMVTCPNVIVTYNKHMGGVDLMNSLIGRGRIIMRTRKWYLRLFYHLIDVATVNAWLLYKRVLENKGTSTDQNTLSLFAFRLQVAEVLCKIGSNTTPVRGRPSSSKEPSKKRLKASTDTPPNVRLDKYDHWPEHITNKQKCKIRSCKGFTRVKCTKCSVYLCFNNKNNCFLKYHTIINI